jgi:translation initiation factor 4A
LKNTSIEADNSPSDEPDFFDSVHSFDEMNLQEELLHGIYSYGFEKPSQIQAKTILPLLSGRDVIAQAQSGSGKTGAFAIGTLQKVDRSLRECQVLILAPTRELAQQSAFIAQTLSTYMKINVHACIGGTNVRNEMNILARGVHVLVATPGRVYDMMSRGALQTKYIRTMILDEADVMLSLGFKDQIHQIFKELPEDVQVGLFSATLPVESLDISEQFMRNPVKILMTRHERPLDGIRQFYVQVERKYKYDVLCDLYGSLNITQAVVFVNTKRTAENLTDDLKQDNFAVSLAHSNLSQDERTKTLEDFRKGSTRVLVATDLYARGVDAVHVSLVINYEMSKDNENYLHRVGRCGRFGKKGVAINFVTPEEMSLLRSLEQYYNTQIDELPANVNSLI